MHVACERMGTGIRLVFSCYEGFEEVFEIMVPKDISTIMKLLSKSVTAEYVMIEVRNMTGITVH